MVSGLGLKIRIAGNTTLIFILMEYFLGGLFVKFKFLTVKLIRGLTQTW